MICAGNEVRGRPRTQESKKRKKRTKSVKRSAFLPAHTAQYHSLRAEIGQKKKGESEEERDERGHSSQSRECGQTDEDLRVATADNVEAPREPTLHGADRETGVPPVRKEKVSSWEEEREKSGNRRRRKGRDGVKKESVRGRGEGRIRGWGDGDEGNYTDRYAAEEGKWSVLLFRTAREG